MCHWRRCKSMPSYQLRLTLLSDATFGSGDGVAGLVDAEVQHDYVGLPFLGGRTLKGFAGRRVRRHRFCIGKGTACTEGALACGQRSAVWPQRRSPGRRSHSAHRRGLPARRPASGAAERHTEGTISHGPTSWRRSLLCGAKLPWMPGARPKKTRCAPCASFCGRRFFGRHWSS